MGFAIIRCAKVGQGGLAALQFHNLREAKNHSNKDIDPSRTHENLVLVSTGERIAKAVGKQVDEIQARQTRKIRKDAPRALEYLVTASPESLDKMSADEQRQYFGEAVRFLQKLHGTDRVVSAVVHLDESTPHLHAVVVPVDKEGKLNAKPFMNRVALKQLQTDFAEKVGARFGLERGKGFDEIGERRAHKSVRDFKRAQEALEAQGKDVTITVPKKGLVELHSAYETRVRDANASLTLCIKALTAEATEERERRIRAEERYKTAEAQRVQLSTEAQKQKTIIEQLTRLVTEVGRLAPAILTKARDAVLLQMKQERQAKPKKDVQR